MIFNELLRLKGRVLNENAALLTKGSRNVLANKNLVASVAAALRDDIAGSPGEFGGKARELSKATDENLVIWFLSELDRMEKEGYEGIISTRDGVNNLWIAQRYAAYNDSWEDITGKLQPAMRNFYILKNRTEVNPTTGVAAPILEPKHAEINRYRGVKDLNGYLVTHYADKLASLLAVALEAAQRKQAKSIKLIDNDDYTIYCPLNRAAATMLGKGSGWCTSMSHTDAHYHSYADQAMLYVLLPKSPENVKIQNATGSKTFEGLERYQFGPDRFTSFKNLADGQVNARMIRERFPYLYSDITTQLAAKAANIESLITKYTNDPTLNSPNLKVKQYLPNLTLSNQQFSNFCNYQIHLSEMFLTSLVLIFNGIELKSDKGSEGTHKI